MVVALGGRQSEVQSCIGARQILFPAKGAYAALSYRHGRCFSLGGHMFQIGGGRAIFLSTSAVCHEGESTRDWAEGRLRVSVTTIGLLW